MKTQRSFLYTATLVFCLLIVSCDSRGQTPPTARTPEPQSPQADRSARVGGECEEGYCELMYFGMPKDIKAEDTSPGWTEKGQKLIVTGTAFQIDGRTPAPNVIIYYHHTDNDGYYSPRNDKPENQTRHGHIRGWVKTDANGKYTIKTIRPGPYPGREDPAHIHLMVKEPDITNEYWLDDLVFDDDKRLIPFRKKHPATNPLGGSGLLFPLIKGDIQIAEHDIILGLNVPNYPRKQAAAARSGLDIGDNQPSFGPYHAFGPDKGTQACPVCRYGRFQGVIYFVGNDPNWNDIRAWIAFLEQESVRRGKFLKAYFVYGDTADYSRERRMRQLEELGTELNVKHIALTFVPSFADTETDANLNKIDPLVENTFIIFRQRRIVDKYVALKPNIDSFRLISAALDRTKSEFFDLPEPAHD
ncbi:MAG: intradiol ring-cleavage dioxygenase [Acidobacteria bacterium]|nr:hypothetical protein [Pyrinomonadaceae bacterium]RIJ95235.1 MAG: intradiol ring-cleavage dioxygenase [Acidobacteriota bacterium]